MISCVWWQPYTRCNISQKVGQIIVPMYRTEEGEEEEEAEFVSEETEGVNGLRVELHADFQVRVRQLQAEARRDLLRARQDARQQLLEQTTGERRKRLAELYALVGIPQQSGRLNRRLLSRLTVGQLNVILNDYLGKRDIQV